MFPASYPIGTRGYYPGVKWLGLEADHSPPFGAEVKECVDLYLHSPNTSSWHGAQLKHRIFCTILCKLVACGSKINSGGSYIAINSAMSVLTAL